MKLARQLQRVIVAELDRYIAELKREGRIKLALKLERFKRVFFVEPSGNFDVDADGVVHY